MVDYSQCSAQGIPEHLWENERGIDPDFDGDEILLRRYRCPLPDDFRDDPNLGVELFEIKDDSYNRTKYCEDNEDVLFNDNPNYNDGNHYNQYGILELTVSELMVSSPIILNGVQVHCELRPEHRPEKCNYAHTEAWFFIDGTKKDSKKPASIKTMFRKLLLKKLRIHKHYQQ